LPRLYAALSYRVSDSGSSLGKDLPLVVEGDTGSNSIDLIGQCVSFQYSPSTLLYKFFKELIQERVEREYLLPRRRHH
jgi:hypothetical protein